MCKIASALLVKHQGGKLCFKCHLCCISSLVCGRFGGEELSHVRSTFVAIASKFCHEHWCHCHNHLTPAEEKKVCTRPALKFTWDNNLCVKVLLLPVAQCNMNSCHLGQAFASESRGPEFESCRIPAEAQQEGFPLNDRTNATSNGCEDR